jgi:hypothetical protein
MNGMDLLAHTPSGCDCGGVGVCPACLQSELEAVTTAATMYREQGDAAVEALRFYADEANWKLHVTPSGWSSAAAADDGERARAALRGQ